MLKNLKYFLKHTLIYSISNIAAKASGIILLPIYSAFLSLGDFGILGIADATIIILVDLINLGLAQALVMLNNVEEYSGRKKGMFFTIFFSSFLICVLFVAAGEALLPSITSSLEEPERYYYYFRIALYVITARILNNILLNKLRAEEKSGTYTAAGILKLLLTLGLVYYFIAVKNLNVEGVLFAYLVAEAAVLIILLPKLLTQMSFKFDIPILKIGISFGIPLIFSSLAMMLLNLSDRYIIKYFLNDEMVGLYDLGYRVAGVLNMFIIVPLSLTLVPQAYKMFGKAGDKRFYSKVLTYLSFGLVWIGLALSLFSKEMIKLLARNQSFWPSYEVVPVVVFAYVFFGMRIVSSLGMYLNKKTKYVAYTTVAAAALNIILNIIFIPKYGMMAAAYSTLISFIFLYLLSYYYGNKSYKIPFENLKITEALIIGVILYVSASFFNSESLGVRLFVKFLSLIFYPLLLYFLKFYEPVEIERVKGFYLKWKNPLKWSDNIRSSFFSGLSPENKHT